MVETRITQVSLLVLSLTAALVLAPSPALGEEVAIKGYSFNPNPATAAPGEEVIWRNGDTAHHTVVIAGQKSPLLKQGDSFRFVAKESGQYRYRCSVHGGMDGVLVVAEQGGSRTSSGVGSGSPGPTAQASSKPANSADHAVPRSAPHADEQGRNVVQIVDFMRYSPAEIVIEAGQTVTWINHDGSNHKIQFADGVSERLGHNARYSKRFNKPGSYDYVCAIHGKKMPGKVVVKPR